MHDTKDRLDFVWSVLEWWEEALKDIENMLETVGLKDAMKALEEQLRNIVWLIISSVAAVSSRCTIHVVSLKWLNIPPSQPIFDQIHAHMQNQSAALSDATLNAQVRATPLP